MKAYILAGGKGTRLSTLTKDEIPKPMMKIAGKPILEHTIEKLKNNGILDIIISVGYLHEKIIEYFSDGRKFGVNIRYIIEKEPLGSGGALYYAKEFLDDDFVVCSGDTIFDIDISRMYDFHKKHKSLITLFTHPNSHPFDSDIIITNEKNLVTDINKKNSERNFYYKNNVNAGFFIISSSTLEYFKEPKALSLEHDFINSFIVSGKVFAYKSPEYIRDVGTPERFFQTEKDLQKGLVTQKNLKNTQKAVFLDRDGTINKYKGFITSPNDIELTDTCAEGIKKLNSSEYLSIVISNQPVIARGEATFETVNTCFDKIETLLGASGAFLDGIYYCPHHPHSGFAGEVKSLKIDCDCRKPRLGLINRAIKDFNLDLNKCYIIGDSNVDIMTAKNAGIKCIRVKSDLEEESLDCFAKVDTLLDAVNIILKEEKNEGKN